MHLLYARETGEILSLQTLVPANLPPEYGIVPDADPSDPRLKTHYLPPPEGGLAKTAAMEDLAPRPAALAPASPATAPRNLPMTDFPDGSTLRIVNELGETATVTDPAATVALADPGRYELLLEPPFPYNGFKMTLTLT